MGFAVYSFHVVKASLVNIRIASLGIVSFAVCFTATIGHAGNREGIYFGEQAVMTGGAVRAIVDDGSAAIYNPAGLGQIDRSIVNVSLSAFQFRTQTQRNAFIVDVNDERSDAYSVRGSELTPVPTSLAFSRPLVGDWVVGLGLFTNSFENTNFSLDGTTLTNAYQVDADIDVQVRENIFRAAAGVGRRLSPKVSFGVSLAARIALNSITSAVSFDVIADNVESSQIIFSRARSTVAGLGVILGTTAEISDRWSFGGVLELPTFRVFERNRTRGSTLSGLVIDGQAEEFENTDTDVRNENGESLLLEFVRAHASFAYRTDRWTLTLESDFSLEPDNKNELQLTPNVRVGLQYTTPRNLSFGFGLFTDSALDDQQSDASLGEYQFAGVSSAVRFQNVREVAEDGVAREIVFSTTFGLRYAYGTNEFRPISLFGTETAAEPEMSTQFAHELSLYIASKFQF